MKKSEIIEKLVNDDLDTVRTLIEENDYTYLDSIFRNGFTGYVNMPKKALEQEYYERLT